MNGTGPRGSPTGARRVVPALVAVALSVAVVAGVLRSGWLEGDPPVPTQPPPAVDTEGAYLVVPYGLSGRVLRWDGAAWVDEQMFLANDVQVGEYGRVYDLREDPVVAAVLLGTAAATSSAPLRVDVGRLPPGWYRLGLGAAAEPPPDVRRTYPPPPPADTPGAAFGLLEVRAGS